jgi:glucose-1-phosphate cytidylyltransferase
VLEFISDDSTSFEQTPVAELAAKRELAAFEHHGFWQAMDTMRDRTLLESLWESGKAPWKVWT